MQRSKLALFFIGVTMGIADLIPGISGSSVAFLSGIYDHLLESIKSLQFHSFKKIAWRFLLPLGLGIATAIILFSKLFYFLLQAYSSFVLSFFFGVITASTLICLRRAKMRKVRHIVYFIIGGVLSFVLASLPTSQVFGVGFFGILFAGILGSAAMLLPGISGSFVLQVIGIYPLVISALARPSQPGAFMLLIALGIGIAIGFAVFSRVISFLLATFHQVTLCVLVGFMAGGLKALWPFDKPVPIVSHVALMLFGAILTIFLEMSVKSMKRQRIGTGSSS